MTSYCIRFRLGPGLDLTSHEMWITAETMPDAIERLHDKLRYRFPNYRVEQVLPTGMLVAEDLVESWRDHA